MKRPVGGAVVVVVVPVVLAVALVAVESVVAEVEAALVAVALVSVVAMPASEPKEGILRPVSPRPKEKDGLDGDAPVAGRDRLSGPLGSAPNEMDRPVLADSVFSFSFSSGSAFFSGVSKDRPALDGASSSLGSTTSSFLGGRANVVSVGSVTI